MHKQRKEDTWQSNRFYTIHLSYPIFKIFEFSFGCCFDSCLVGQPYNICIIIGEKKSENSDLLIGTAMCDAFQLSLPSLICQASGSSYGRGE